MSYDDSEGNPFVQDFIYQNLLRQLEDIEEERWMDSAEWIAFVRGNIDPMSILYIEAMKNRPSTKLREPPADYIDPDVWPGCDEPPYPDEVDKS